MKHIVNYIFYQKKLILFLFTLIFAYGLYSYFVIPKQDMPKIDTPFMVLTITAPSLDAVEMESLVINDVEKTILSYPDVNTVETTIYDSFSIILITYSFSVDSPSDLSLLIYNDITTNSLNDNITEISYTSNFEDPHIIFSLYSDNLTTDELISYGEEFKEELLLQSEVKHVEIDSAYQNEVVITLDTEKLQLYDLDVYEIYQILYANSYNLPLGGITTSYGIISISGSLTIDDIESLENMIIIPEIPLVLPTLYLKDLATISIEDTNEKLYKFNDSNAMFLSLYFEDNIDLTKMGDEIKALKGDFLQETNNSDLFIDQMLFSPDYINSQINNVFYSLLICILVVMIIVFIGIGFRNSILIILTIPLIIFGTIAVLYTFGFELHKLTIVGLIVAIGILVDNSIVITEGVKTNIDQGINKIESAKKAITDNSIPILSSTLTTIAAFFVLVILPGFLGGIVSSMPLTVIIAISLSYITSIFLSPILSVYFLKETKTNKTKQVSIHQKNIKKMIRFTVKFPLIWIVVSGVILVLSVYFTFKNQPIDLYPIDERSVLYIDYENSELGNIDSTIILSDEIIDLFRDNPNVINYATSIGGNLPNFHFSSRLINDQSHLGRIYINFNYNEKSLLNYKLDLEELTKSIENAKISISNVELSPPLAPLILLMESDNFEQLDLSSDNIFSDIAQLDTVKSYRITSSIESLKFKIVYDFEAISEAYLTKIEVDKLIAYTLNGFDIETFTYNEELINININTDIEQINDILDLTIYSDTLDTNFLLSELITIENEYDYVVINRINNMRTNYIELYFTEDSDINKLEKEVNGIIDNYTLGEVNVYYSGENEMFEEISGNLIRASIMALILIYIVMLIQFHSFIKPLIVFLTIPLSLSGSFLSLMIFNSPITATALIGMVSLIGVTVNTGILLVEYISRNHNSGNHVKQSCIDAVYARFRPIMLTSLTTILGLIPLLLTGGNFFKPLAITFMGGMVTSTIFTIFLVPSMYCLIYTKKKKKKISD